MTYYGQADYNFEQGNLLVGDGIKPSNKPPGLDGQVLMADSAQADGVSWSSIANIQSAEILLTSLQVKNLIATPILLIPAQGANTVIVLINCVGRLNYGGTSPFIAPSNIELAYGNPYVVSSGVTAVSTTELVAIVDSTRSESFSGFGNALNSEIYNVDIYLTNAGVIEISGNAADDNTVSVKCLYYVFTIP